jgi:hypothetical protein
LEYTDKGRQEGKEQLDEGRHITISNNNNNNNNNNNLFVCLIDLTA